MTYNTKILLIAFVVLLLTILIILPITLIANNKTLELVSNYDENYCQDIKELLSTKDFDRYSNVYLTQTIILDNSENVKIDIINEDMNKNETYFISDDTDDYLCNEIKIFVLTNLADAKDVLNICVKFDINKQNETITLIPNKQPITILKKNNVAPRILMQYIILASSNSI